MYFRVSVVSEVGTRAPTPFEVTQPQHLSKLRSLKKSLRYACFLCGIRSLDYISHLISSKYQIIDHSLS